MDTPRRPPRLLLTGFEPFGGEAINPSLEVARALDGATIGGATVVAVGLPCVYAGAVAGLQRALDAIRPVQVVGLGQAAGATGLLLERVALNLTDAAAPDNDGVVLRDQPVVPGAPAAHFATLPLRAMLDALHAEGHPAALSLSAGSYVCNHVFYTLLHTVAGRGVPAGFIHLPLLPRQAVGRVGAPSLPLDLQVAAVRHALDAARVTG